MARPRELGAEACYRRCDPGSLGFATTRELEVLEDVVGQRRAIAALEFGVGMSRRDYNLFAFGPVGTGRHYVTRHFLERVATGTPTPSDWCYVRNFHEPHKPVRLELPAGAAPRYARTVSRLAEDLRSALREAYESEEFQRRREAVEEAAKEETEAAIAALKDKALERGFVLLRSPVGVLFAPTRDGEIVGPEDLESLGREEQLRIESAAEELQKEMQAILRRIPRHNRVRRDQLREIEREIARVAVEPFFDELRREYRELPQVLAHLEAVERFVMESPALLLASGEEGTETPPPFEVQVLVGRTEGRGAPVVYEPNPSFANLVGRIEHRVRKGELVTDITLIRGGALHEANGGFLVLDARQVLLQPYAWEGLKRALQVGEVRIESPAQALGLVSTATLEPEPIPLSVKVVLVGEPLLYYLLSAHDPDFGRLFKVAVDFEESFDLTPDSVERYVRLVARVVREEELLPFEAAAVARVVEESSREVADSEKLSAATGALCDLLRESDYWARCDGAETVGHEAVQRAIDARIFHMDRLRERVHEAILRGMVLVRTEGERVGQINGLAVLSIGGFSFGRPTRISARVGVGTGEVLDIEREVELSGPIHSKGVLILSGFLTGRFAARAPLALAARLVFEQSYSGVEGDSASSAELFALLSALAELPLRQDLAVTGSVNQHGEVQPVGGVNQKVEGFFDVCSARGLTGSQGVLIPASNVKHLMLRADVVAAVGEGRFRIWPIRHVDEGIELLTGRPAGEADDGGAFPPESVNGLVGARLAEMAATLRAHRRGPE